MTPREEGFLLLASQLGDPGRKPLTLPQLRNLSLRMRGMKKPLEDRDMTPEDLAAIGCSAELSQRILGLLSQNAQLQWYLGKGESLGCNPITRASEAYPEALRRNLGMDTPSVLWAKGDVSIMNTPTVALVGSRELEQKNWDFAWEVGKQAALQGYTLVSGNARGADRTAQEACLEYGGKVISIVADELIRQEQKENILYLSEDSYDLGFSARRALERNRIIHGWGQKVFVAQSRLETGGTWKGTEQNLSKNWTPVFCFADRTAATEALILRGASPVTIPELSDFSKLQPAEFSIFAPQ